MTRYLGGLITKDESLVLPTNNFQDTSAPGVWTLEEAQALNKQGLWPTPGNTNPAKFVENVFSVDTYTGNATARSITTGIDLAGEGGLVWGKARGGSYNNWLYDTVRGAEKPLVTNTNGAEQSTSGAGLTAFTSDGFTLAASSWWNENHNTVDQVAWTFRKAPKFFDIVTYTGNGSNQNISHNLGATPGFVMVKKTSGTGHWSCWHRSLTSEYYILLNTTGAQADGTVGARTVNDSTYQIFGDFADEGADGATYVMYLFGHDTSSDGMIQCGTVDVDGSNNATVNLGFEPQWFLGRTYTSSADWEIHDTQRNWNVGNLSKLHASGNVSETTYNAKYSWATNTGFETSGYFSGSQKLLYVAIRRGPMQTPTSRASVFNVQEVSSAASSITNIGFPTDLSITKRTTQTGGWTVKDRMRGGTKLLQFHNTNNEQTDTGGNNSTSFSHMDSFNPESSNNTNASYQFRRAPGFFDIVAYIGNETAGRTINHNLGVVPDMIIFKIRDNANASVAYERGWLVTSLHLPNTTATNDTTLYLDTNAAELDETIMNDTAPTSTVFSLGTDPHANYTNVDYVAYLFANLAGISKVGTFSHTNGSSTDVDCGFSSGASFVIVKRTDSTGDWHVWDSVRGIVSGNDGYILLNSTAVAVTNTDYIDPLNSGFQIASGFTTGSYFFYAIAA